MENSIYRIGKLLAVSFGVDVFLLAVLFALSFLVGGSSVERIVLAVFLLPSLYVCCELWTRRLVLDDRGIRLEKLLRRKELRWKDVTSVGALVLRSRTYLLLTTTKGFVSISNAYENFPRLLQDIVERVDPGRIEEEVRQQMNAPRANHSGLFKSWIAAAVLLALIILKGVS